MALSADSAVTGATTSRILNKLAYAIANKASDITTAASGDIMLMVDASDDYELKYADQDNIKEFVGLDGITAGTSAASKAVVLDANEEFDWTVSNASTDGGTSVEPLNFDVTMTGAGGVGGRAKFTMSTEVVLGGWANALKAEVDFGSTGAVTGLGSAFVAEMTLGLSMASGNYAPLEIELNAPSGADTGTATALIYASVNGADSTTVDTAGYLLNLAGVATAAEDKLWAAHTLGNINEVTHGLRIKTPDGDFYLLAATAANFT